MCFLKNKLRLLKYVGRPNKKNVIKWKRKTATEVINPRKIKGNADSERLGLHWELKIFKSESVKLHSTPCFNKGLNEHAQNYLVSSLSCVYYM